MQTQPPRQEYLEIPKVDAKTAATELKDLRDIAVPAPVSWKPQTAGWAILGVLVLAALAAAVWRAVRRHEARRYRREALAELDRLEPLLRDPSQRPAGLFRLSALVKRTRLSEAPREMAAALSGQPWMQQLDATWRPSFTDGPGEPLADLVYHSDDDIRSLSDADVAALTTTVRRWITGHHAAVR